jgi:hypothetical protein
MGPMNALWAGPESSPARQTAEERCHARVCAAKLRFELALARVASSVGDPAVQEIERQARSEYQRELQIFTDLVVRGKMPTD